VYLIRVGATRFVVWDPEYANPAAEYGIVEVMDSAFTVLAIFTI
jgi:hypothetical protein